jgi:NADH:ubiquinone oxidoreductase subunit E
VRGAQAIVNEIQKELGLRPGQTTADGRLGVQIARCIGCCGLAPAVVLDDQVLAKVKPGEIAGILRDRAGGRK